MILSMTGFGREELEGQLAPALRSGLHAGELLTSLLKEVALHGVWYGRLFSRHRNGTLLSEQVTVSPLANDLSPNGTPLHITAIEEPGGGAVAAISISGPKDVMSAEALERMGRADLIGNGKHHLIPTFQPATDGSYQSARRKNSTPVGVKAAPNRPVAKAGVKSGAAPSGQKILVPGSRGQAAPAAKAPPKPGTILTQHTGLPPRVTGAARRRPR